MYLRDLQEEDFEIAVKVVIVGNGAVGKSSMIQKYCKGIFTAEYKKTIGVDFLEKRICVNGEDVRMMLWDTAGQEEFDCITRAYYRGAQACVLAFSCVDRESFKQVARWKRKVEEECGNIPMVMVMTKMDLLYKAAMDSFEVEKMSRNLGLPLIKTSVKENLNVSKVFYQLATQHLSSVSEWSEDPPIIQIGGGRFTTCSQADFLTRYERSWEVDEKEARRKKRKLQKQRLGVSLCSDSYSSYCDTRAFFLTPVRSKNRDKAANKVDFRSVCKIL